MKFKIKIISGHYKGMWYADPIKLSGSLTYSPARAKIFTKFPRALYDRKHDRLVHVWDKSEGDCDG